MVDHKMIFKILYTASILGLTYCSSPEPNDSLYPKHLNGVDTFIYDVPGKFQDISFTRKMERIEQEIAISSLRGGFDSLEIRLWFEYAFKDSAQLIILRNANQEWKGYILDLKFNYDTNDSLVSVSKTVKDMKPESGWQDLIAELLHLKIHSLPDFGSIQGYDVNTDGDFITVEVAAPKMYRIYSYQQPIQYQSKIVEASNVEKIMELIEKESSFKRLRKF